MVLVREGRLDREVAHEVFVDLPERISLDFER